MTATPLSTPLPRLLLTWTAGGLGKVLRTSLKPHCTVLRLSDIAEMAPAGRVKKCSPATWPTRRRWMHW